MQHDFWHLKWQKNEISFHLPQAHPLLVRHLPSLGLAVGKRIFLPLCGKTRDIAWLLAQGYRVVGAELSPIAVAALFDELKTEQGIVAQREARGALAYWHAEGLEIYSGDVFQLNAAMLGKVDAIYDRAALVALPAHMRLTYARHIQEISAAAPQLLICFEYDQSLLAGPPFSIDAQELAQHYGENYTLKLLEKAAVDGGLKGQTPANECVWQLLNHIA